MNGDKPPAVSVNIEGLVEDPVHKVFPEHIGIQCRSDADVPEIKRRVADAVRTVAAEIEAEYKAKDECPQTPSSI
jgi:hypothetical protein